MADNSLTYSLYGRDVSASRALEAVGDTAEEQGSRVSGAMEKAGQLGGVALAGGLAVGLAAGIDSALEQSGVETHLKASLGLSEAEAEEYGQVAGDVYAKGYVGSLEEASDAVVAVGRNMSQDLVAESSAGLEGLSSQVTALTTTFGVDALQVTTAAQQLVTNGLAPNLDAAMDMVAGGLQNVKGDSGEFLDTLKEYSPQFEKFGLSGEEAMGMMAQATQNGTYSADLAADAFKELSIRAVDGSETTVDAYESLGLSAGQMADDFAAGGDRSKEALDKTLDALRAIEDPVERNRVGVELFGTQWEDAGDSLLSVDLDTATTALGDMEGAAQGVVDTLEQDPAAKLEALKRGITQKLGDVVLVIADFAQKNQDWLLPLVGMFAGVAGAIGAVVGVVKAISGVTKAWTAVQAAFNFVMALNPVFLIIAGIVALGVALVVAYKKSETFRNIVDSAFGKVKEAFGKLKEAAQKAWEYFKQNVWPGLKDGAKEVGDKLKELWQNYGKPAFDALVDGGKKVVGFLQDNWPTIKNVLKFIGDAIMKLWKSEAKIALEGIGVAFKIAFAVIKFVVDRIIDNIKATIAIFKAIKSTAETVWNAIKTAIRTAWNAIKSVFDSLKNGVQLVRDKFNAAKTSISNAWEGIRSKLHSGWSWINTNVFSKMKSIVGTLSDAFASAKDAIGRAWDKIRDKASKPVSFVVNTVFKQMVEKFNAIVSKVGVSKLPVPSVPFAVGGEVPSRLGKRGKDSVAALLMPDEHVWTTAEVAAAGGHRAVEHIRQLALAGRLNVYGDPSAGVIQRYATGGEVTAAQMAKVTAAQKWLPSVDPLPYVWGGVGPNGYDCSGLVGEVWARLTGHSSYRRYMTTNTILDSPGALGLAKGAGLYSIGVSRTHTAGNLGGLAFEAASSKSGIKVGASAKPVSSFPSVYHLAKFGTAGFQDGGGFDPVAWAKSQAKAAISKLTDGWWSKLRSLGGGGLFGDMAVGYGKKMLTSIFDRGGLLQPGMSMVYNGTGAPEAVLTGSQWATMNSAAASPRNEVHVHVHNAVVGNEQQVAKAVRSALASTSGTGLRFA